MLPRRFVLVPFEKFWAPDNNKKKDIFFHITCCRTNPILRHLLALDSLHAIVAQKSEIKMPQTYELLLWIRTVILHS